MTEASPEQHAPWLLLMFTLSAKQGSERVEVWRKLKRCGAVSLRASGYLLPHTPETKSVSLKKVYTSNWHENKIGVIDLRQMKVIKKIPTGDKPDGSA